MYFQKSVRPVTFAKKRRTIGRQGGGYLSHGAGFPYFLPPRSRKHILPTMVEAADCARFIVTIPNPEQIGIPLASIVLW